MSLRDNHKYYREAGLMPTKKRKFKVWYQAPNSAGMNKGMASFNISGFDTDYIAEKENVAEFLEKALNAAYKTFHQ